MRVRKGVEKLSADPAPLMGCRDIQPDDEQNGWPDARCEGMADDLASVLGDQDGVPCHGELAKQVVGAVPALVEGGAFSGPISGP